MDLDIGRVAVAATWGYEGAWCKLLRADPGQRAIVAAVPGLPARWATPALIGIGALETAIGAWVLSGVRPRAAAWVQTGLLVAFNGGGLAFGRTHITAPGRMLLRNAVLLALVWSRRAGG